MIVCVCVSASAIRYWFDFIPITQCLPPPAVQKIVIPGQQQGKKSRDPQRGEFIGSVGQLGQLIMLLSGGRGLSEGGRREEGREEGRKAKGKERGVGRDWQGGGK